jgi:phosphodiesterase/alkaline phosphatase D-like protein
MFKVGDKVYAYDGCRGSFGMARGQGTVVEIKKKIVAHTIVETYRVQWERQGKKINDRFFYKHEIYGA